jgi:hypothetical protein
MSMDFEIFRGKRMSDLFEDIYRNQQTKKKRISELIHEIRTKVKDAKDMAMLYPIIKDLVDTSVKNDDALVKMATIAQRIINSENKTEGDTGFLSTKEKEELLNIAREQAELASKRLNKEINDVNLNVEEIQKQIEDFNESEG